MRIVATAVLNSHNEGQAQGTKAHTGGGACEVHCDGDRTRGLTRCTRRVCMCPVLCCQPAAAPARSFTKSQRRSCYVANRDVCAHGSNVRAMLALGVHVCVALVVGVVLSQTRTVAHAQAPPHAAGGGDAGTGIGAGVAGAATSGAWWGHCVARRRQHHAFACFRFVCVFCSYSRPCTCT